MGDRPILFSAPMIRAILREVSAPGTGKTQTRRVLNVDPTYHLDSRRRAAAEAGHYWFTEDLDMPGGLHVVPRFAPGDRLWVREAFSYDRLDVDRDGILPPWYWADGNPDAGDWTRPKPSIHMPRWASRLTLHVTDLRVQRLQEISEADARAEGVERDSDGWRDYQMPQTQCCGSARNSFATLWDSLNAERAPWASNPWVVAVTFSPMLGNIDAVAA